LQFVPRSGSWAFLLPYCKLLDELALLCILKTAYARWQLTYCFFNH
jgi:hypothetical protein